MAVPKVRIFSLNHDKIGCIKCVVKQIQEYIVEMD